MRTCTIANCGGNVHARGLCMRHYLGWRRGATIQTGMESFSYKGPRRVRFTVSQWERWRAERQVMDARRLERREGIQTLRSLLASQQDKKL